MSCLDRLFTFAGIWVLIVFAFLVSSPVSVLAIEAGSIGGRPATPLKDNERSTSIFTYKTDAGTVLSDAIEVFNNSDTKKVISVYATDSQIASGGSFACAQKADTPKMVGKWIVLSRQTVTLEPGSKSKIPFTVTVPKDAAPGEQNGCIAIQDTTQAPAKQSNGISINTRSAIRAAIMVQGDIKKQLAFTALSVRPSADNALLASTSLQNTGNVSLDTKLGITLNAFGFIATRHAGGDFPALAGAQSDFNFQVKRPFWGGWYMLSAAAAFNPDPKAMLGEKTDLRSIHARKIVFITPQPLAAIIEAALVLLVVALLFWGVRRYIWRRTWQRQGIVYTIQVGDSLQSIARKYAVSWKHIARLNRLKAPFALTPSRRLRLPVKKRKTHTNIRI